MVLSKLWSLFEKSLICTSLVLSMSTSTKKCYNFDFLSTSMIWSTRYDLKYSRKFYNLRAWSFPWTLKLLLHIETAPDILVYSLTLTASPVSPTTKVKGTISPFNLDDPKLFLFKITEVEISWVRVQKAEIRLFVSGRFLRNVVASNRFFKMYSELADHAEATGVAPTIQLLKNSCDWKHKKRFI